MQKHIYVKQKGIEEISREDLNSLAILTDLNLDETSNLIGKVHTTNLFIKTKEVLEQKFPQFKIDYDTLTIIDTNRKDSPILQNSDKALMEIISKKNWSTNNFFMTTEEAASIKGRLSGVFTAAIDIVDFSAFKYFTGITEIYGNVFQNCKKLETIILPPNAKINSWGDSITFKDCVNLKNITLNNVTTDYASVFVGCTSLKRIEFPEGTISISNFHTIDRPGCFNQCTSLESIKIPSTLKYLGNISQDNGSDSYLSPAFSNTNLITIEGWDTSNIEIIGTACFCNNNSQTLKLNRLPSSVKQIGRRAFDNQQNIAFTELPEGLTHIGDKAFYNTKCNFIKLPESVTTIFYNGKLQSGGFPWANTTGTQTYPLYNSYYISWSGYGEEALGSTALSNSFLDCDNEGNVTLKKLQKIGQSAFEGNINLKTIEGCGSTIGSYAFKGCSSLINVKGTTGSIGTSIGIFQNSGLTEITDDIWNLFGTSIPRNTFINSELKGKIIIPEKITTIESANDFPFNGTKIKELVLPSNLSILASGNAPLNIPRIRKINTNNITHIAQDMFYNTPCLKFLQFDKVSNINSYQRYGNNCGIKYIYLNFNSVCPWWGTSYFGIPNFTKFCVPTGMKSKYLEDNNWKNIPDRIIEVTSQEIEQLKKEYYGVDFFGDKYYDTKRRILQTSKFILEAEYFGGGSGRIFGISTNSQGYGGYWPRAEFTNSFSWLATYTGNISISSSIKHHIEFNKDSITVNGNTILSNRTDSYNYKTTAYLGALNYNNTAISKWQGTIYKFLWYEGDTLVQAWIGNENGGFDIYADEDIEPQENDTINSLEMYAIRYQQQ